MSDHILSAVLTFSLLAAGTAAIGSEMFGHRHRAAEPTAVASLPAVTVTGHRTAVADAVTLPEVRVTGHRLTATAVAVATRNVEQRVQ